MVQIVLSKTSRQSNTSTATLEEEIDYAAVRKALIAARKRKGALLESERTFHRLCIKLLKKVVKPQWEKSFNLNLSNDAETAKMLGCTARQARRAREALSAVGVLFVPDWARQKKKGDYPVWMLSFDFVTGSEQPAPTTSASKRNRANSRYNGTYWRIYDEAKQHARDIYDEMGVETVSVTEFMKNVWWSFSEMLSERGLTRADLMK
ncbi:hypothetical protein [Schaalia suimastitidis]|uniref:hypothetical protein n=1 Tax=Schaalia suimastitidis TaxID=121163 RepID=UPI000479684E|nr:hypothetical protein [Schaalia suimastitidis]